MCFLFEIRPALQSDQPHIESLIKLVKINPFGLDWRRFLVAVDNDGRIIGCGQLKPHSNQSLELASIAVHPNYRRHGVARAIIVQLLQQTSTPVYLTCRKKLTPFYQKFAFEISPLADLPPYFKRIYHISLWLSKLKLIPEEIAILARLPGDNPPIS